ncbi:MAG: glycosyltransferase family 4 protein, partial [Acidimicrobiia bacterium]|nr:glycosyltransferase family 4 protein [Acidimicrobiia bacterium]
MKPVRSGAVQSNRTAPGVPAWRVLHIFTVPQTLVLVGAQVDALRQQGFEFRFAASPGNDLDTFAHEHDSKSYGIPMKRAISPFADLTALVRLIRAIRDFRPHLVHSHTPKAGLLGMLASTLGRTPARVYQMRGLLSPTARGLKRSLFDTVERVSCSLAHRVVCQGPSLRDEALRRRLCSADKAIVLGAGGNGVDATGRFEPSRHQSSGAQLRSELGFGPSDLVIGFVGRLVRDKGIEDLLLAWQKLRGVFTNAHLLLVGPRERRDDLDKELARGLVSDRRIHQTGIVGNIESYYAAMVLLVLPSYREGLPNALLEAAAMELPVVATQVMGCVDAVDDGVTGTLVPARAPERLAGA